MPKKKRPQTKRRAFIRRRLVAVAVVATYNTHRYLQITFHLPHDMRMTAQPGNIYVGIGGWTYEPWRGVFYPKGLPHARELAYAGAHLTSIEINGTFYRTQSPATFRKWASEVPDEFVFSLKGPRYAVNRRVLSEAGDSIKRFLDSGVTELGDRLGPLLWQFAPTKKFDESRFRRIPRIAAEAISTASRCAMSSKSGTTASRRRHSWRCCAGSQFRSSSPSMTNTRRSPTSQAISSTRGCRRVTKSSRLAIRRKRWMAGPRAPGPGRTAASRRICRGSRKHRAKRPRDVFIYFIHEAKLRAPAAAMA